MAVGLDESSNEALAWRAVIYPPPLIPEMDPPLRLPSPPPLLPVVSSSRRGAGCRLSVPELCEIDNHMNFYPAEAMTISCGTVCVDLLASKLLVVLNKKLNIYQLPKGRKHIGEGFHAAALRETYEETGVKATLLPLTSCTRATRPTCKEKTNNNQNNTKPHSRGNIDHDEIAATAATTTTNTTTTDRICCTTRTDCAVGRTASNEASEGPPSSSPSPHSTSGVTTTITTTTTRASTATEPYLTDDDDEEEGGSLAPTPTSRSSTKHGSNNSDSSSSSACSHTDVPACPDPFIESLATQYMTQITDNIALDPDLTLDFPAHTEPLGVVKYRDPQVSMPGTRKFIFYFAACADSTLALGAGAQENHEKLAPEWVPLSAGPKVLRFWAEGMAVWKLWAELTREGRIGCGI